jgi:hypothetical protein
MHCDLNNDYRTQDVQFVLKDATNSVRYANNTNVYNDGSGFSASSYMISNKSANCVNIYLSASVNNQVASYYSGFGDYIFVLNQMANGSSSTGSHEVGHFFSLPHTFFGWEGTNFNDGTAPNSVAEPTVLPQPMVFAIHLPIIFLTVLFALTHRVEETLRVC